MLIAGQPLICAISGKEIKEQDNVIFFPPFGFCTPQDPEFICYEGHVLREEFEKWAYRESVIKKVKDSEVEGYLYHRKHFEIIMREDDFLLVRQIYDGWYCLFFHKYSFYIEEIKKEIWPSFLSRLISEYGEIVLDSQTKISWEDRLTTVILSKETHILERVYRDRVEIPKTVHRDRVEIPKTEWDYFRGMISKLA